MDKDNLKNMVVIKNLPSNIVDEAIVILKPNIKIKNLDNIEKKNNKGSKKKNDNNKPNPKKYIINEAEMVIGNYISGIENNKRKNIKENKKMEMKYKRLKLVSIILGVVLLLSFLIR